MIVRRLMAHVMAFAMALGSRIAAKLARVFEPTMTLLFGPRATPRRAPMPASASAAIAATLPARPAYTITNWLEDARLLRGQPTPRAVSLHPAPAALRQVLHDPHWTSAFEAGRLLPPVLPPRLLSERDERDERDERASHDAPREGDPDTPHETLRALPHRPPAPSGPLPVRDTPDPVGADARGEAESQRRLLLIRELVHRGLYNEGFKPGHIPDQYRPRPMPPGSSTSEPSAE